MIPKKLESCRANKKEGQGRTENKGLQRTTIRKMKNQESVKNQLKGRSRVSSAKK